MGETLAQASAPLKLCVVFFFFDVNVVKGQNITTFLSFLSLFGMFSVDNCSFECVSYRFLLIRDMHDHCMSSFISNIFMHGKLHVVNSQ